MSDSFLRYTDIAAAIQRAREAGMTTIQIVRLLTGSTAYEEARRIAKRAAPLLEISVEEFLRLRKNEPGSG